MQTMDALAALKRGDIDGPRALAILGQVAAAAGQGAANQVLQHWLASPPTAPGVLAQAHVMMAHGRTDIGVSILEAALGVGPEDIEVLDQLAMVSMRRADLGRAIALWQQWTAKHPNDYIGWFKLGYYWIRDGRLEEAIAAIERVLELEPDLEPAIINLYVLRSRTGRPAVDLLGQLSDSVVMVCHRTCGIISATPH